MSLSEKVLRFFRIFIFFWGCHRRLDIFDPKKKEENKKKVEEQGQRFVWVEVTPTKHDFLSNQDPGEGPREV
jgi:hypothetical protein